MADRHGVICQKWEESERGFGTRPDGWTVHLSDADLEAFVKEHWSQYPDDDAPDCYTRPDGKPYEMEIDEALYQQLLAARRDGRFGVWGPGAVPPHGQQGPDGSCTVKRRKS